MRNGDFEERHAIGSVRGKKREDKVEFLGGGRNR